MLQKPICTINVRIFMELCSNFAVLQIRRMFNFRNEKLDHFRAVRLRLPPGLSYTVYVIVIPWVVRLFVEIIQEL